jgi:class 3 adenylate cyclase/predicted negative regulator of RcsB-dependent stress response
VKRCASCGEENADRARFCQNCATPLPEPDGPAGETRRVVTIVFADVTGSTALGERLDPEALRRVMSRFFDRMAAVIQAHEGTVEKFIGDAVMAVFGIPRLHEDDALRAVRAAAGMNAALAELNAELERDHGVGLAARIGVNTGEVVAGDPSAGQRLVTGDAVNVAARLEQAAAPGEVLLGDSTHRLVKDAVEVEPVAPLDLKGKSEAVPAFRLVAVREGGEGHDRHLDSPMVGREKELDLLQRALERAVAERTAHLFTLLGPAGVGKSRLVLELLGGPARDATVLRGRCLSYGEGITFYPVAEAIQSAAGVERTDDVSTARTKLAALLEGSEEERIGSLVGGLLAWDEPGATEDAFWAVRKLFEHLARDRPLVVVFDDIHWGEPTFLDLVEHLADWTRDAAVLLVCVARPELLDVRPGWGGGKMNATSILLEPLDGDSSSRLVDNLLGSAEIPDAARARILDAAEGNPLFVEEMLGMLIDDGLLRFEDGTWRAVEDLADLTVPPTIQLLLAARIDRLDAEERAVMERGAVEGKVFHSGAVATLASDTLRPNVPSRLLALARKELIRPDRAEFAGEDAFRFRHLLIRDAAYQAMPKEQRAELHERYAAWLEGAAGERFTEYEEILAHHLEQAYRYRLELGPTDGRTRELAAAAVGRLRSSADRAQRRGDFAAARRLLERAVELLQGSERARALVELALTVAQLHDYQAAAVLAQDAIGEAEKAGDRIALLRARLIAAEAGGQIDPTHSLARTRQEVDEALGELEAAGDERGIVWGTLAAGRVAFYEGRCDLATELTERLLGRAGELTAREAREAYSSLMVCGYFGTANPDQFDRIRARAKRILKVEGLLTAVMTSMNDMARSSFYGLEAETVAHAEQIGRLWEEIANPDMEILSCQWLGECMQRVGRLADAERSFRDGVENLDRLGETGFNSTMTGLLANALCDLERWDEAEHFIERSREMAAPDDFASHFEWRRALARVLASRGNALSALELVDEAIGFVQATDYLVMKAEGRELRGDVLAALGRAEEARAELERAASDFERKGSIPDAERARRRLAELGS